MKTNISNSKRRSKLLAALVCFLGCALLVRVIAVPANVYFLLVNDSGESIENISVSWRDRVERVNKLANGQSRWFPVQLAGETSIRLQFPNRDRKFIQIDEVYLEPGYYGLVRFRIDPRGEVLVTNWTFPGGLPFERAASPVERPSVF